VADSKDSRGRQEDIDVTNDVDFVAALNDLLVATYGDIDALEHQLHRSHGLNLSVAETNLIEAVGRATLHTDAHITVTEIAERLGVKAPSATAAVNRLVAKGMLAKVRDEADARRVNVTLTREGEKVYRMHVIFHRRMATEVAGGLTAEERIVLLEGVRRLERFYAMTLERGR
jgi:DNA-binding MarR family transcriptional regulator